MKVVKIYTTALFFSLLSLTVVASAAVRPIDFSTWVAETGQWKIEQTPDGPALSQTQASGGHAAIFSKGIALPESFSFQAEIGCISGNSPSSRPYFGIVINRQGNNDYGFLYRKTADQFELVKNTYEQSPRTFLGTVPKPEAWKWELAEWHTLKVVKRGANLKAYVDGKEVLNIDGADYSGGGLGFYTYSTAGVFRNIVYETLD